MLLLGSTVFKSEMSQYNETINDKEEILQGKDKILKRLINATSV